MAKKKDNTTKYLALGALVYLVFIHRPAQPERPENASAWAATDNRTIWEKYIAPYLKPRRQNIEGGYGTNLD